MNDLDIRDIRMAWLIPEGSTHWDRCELACGHYRCAIAALCDEVERLRGQVPNEQARYAIECMREAMQRINRDGWTEPAEDDLGEAVDAFLHGTKPRKFRR